MDLKERDKWDRKAEYILSMMGYLVGLGNLWRFPYVCMRNGGGAFIIPYIFFLVFCGIPLFFLESAIGQFSGKGFYHVWEVCPIFRGHVNWQLVLCLIGAWFIVGLCLMKGVKSVGKVVYVTATLPYILLTIILIRGLSLDGSISGVIFYLRPNFGRLLDIQVWNEAALQVFYSLGPGWGGIISMSSFNKFKNNCLRDSVLLCVLSEGTSIYAGLVVFTVLGYMSTKLSLPLDEIVKSGPGLGFIAYPEALAHLPGENFWSCLFFIMLLTVGLDSLLVGCETVLGVFTDSFEFVRRRRLVFLTIYCTLNILLGLVLCSQGGIYVFQLLDWYVAAFALPIFGLLECIIFAWIYGLDRLSQDVKLMLGRGVPMFFRVCLGFVTPAVLLGIIVSSFIGYKPPTYGSYSFPDYAVGIGIFISVLPLLPIPICALVAVKNADGLTLTDKIKTCLKPTPRWIPANTDHKYDSINKYETE